MNRIVLGLIIANFLTTIKGFQDDNFFNKYKFQVGKILNGEKIRMVTSGFLHADWVHFGFNMYALYLFGRIVTIYFSDVNFLLIYFASLLAGSMYSLLQNKKDYYYSAIGASGAVSGVIFSGIMLYPEMELIMFPLPIPLPGYVFGIGYLLYSIYGMKAKMGNIGHSAHLGGAIGGFLITLWLRPAVFNNNPSMILIMGAIIVALFLFGDKLERL
ncbi:rhomboid family intramembrane serine protease [Tenacibaculum sp. MEBiC06402]|uniref:rhomboid family intramembrane serine protease n=1 Tax=unclassified Tenacibaculum TaxID=2635139 RepID=UPI003B9D9EF1